MIHISTKLKICFILSGMLFQLQAPAWAQQQLTYYSNCTNTANQKEYKLLVLLVKTTDDPQPSTLAQAQNLVFGPKPSIVDWFKTVSYGKACFSGTVAGWYTIPELHNVLNEKHWGWDQVWDVIFQKIIKDVDIRKFDKVVLVNPQGTIGDSGTAGSINHFPQDPNKYNIGVAYVVSAGTYDQSAHWMVHELAHTFGPWESCAYACSNKSISNQCLIVVNGDEFDTLGTNMGHFNAVQMDYLGWLRTEAGESIYVTESKKSYTIQAIEKNSGVRSLKIPADFDPQGNPTDYYYVEYRLPIAYDAEAVNPWGNTRPFGGVLIHLGPMYSGLLLDMNPTADPSKNEVWDFHPEPLLPGKSFLDPVRGIKITLNSISDAGANVSVEIDQTLRSRDQLPTVNFTNLKNNDIVLGNKVITLDVQDDRGIKEVNIIGASGIFPMMTIFLNSRYLYPSTKFEWHTLELKDGIYTLEAQVTDTSNRVGTAKVTVQVKNKGRDTTAPVVSITSPAAGAIMAGKTTLFMQTSDPGYSSGLAEIAFEIKPMPLGEYKVLGGHPMPIFMAGTPPYSFVLFPEGRISPSGYTEGFEPLPDGNYLLRAYVKDNDGNVGYSQPIPVGIWKNSSPVTVNDTLFIRGDVNADALVNQSDLANINNYLINNLDMKSMNSADVNDDGLINNRDADQLLNFLNHNTGYEKFAPIYPFPLPDRDPTIEAPVIVPTPETDLPRIFRRGEIDNVPGIQINDAMLILKYLFEGQGKPGCLDAADIDDNGIVNISDAVLLLQYLYSGGRAPAEPFKACGLDSTPDNLSCERPLSCVP